MEAENHNPIPDQMERRILHGLSCEWSKALGFLSPEQRKRMRLPLFCLRNLENRWGTWSEEKREISLSRSLVHDHSWDAVREVLLHEMAHQMAMEALAGSRETPHGPQFQMACRILRANPRASETFSPRDERILRAPSLPSDKRMLRVKKLLALAGSPDRHEADAAMVKAHQLMVKYNIEQRQGGEDRDLASLFLGQPALRHFPEDYALVNLLLDFYFVAGIWVAAYVPARGKMGRVLEISGTLPNLKMAHYVYEFVRRFIHSQWVVYNQNRGLSRHRQTDFGLGILEGFRWKLEATRRGKNANPFALVRKEDPLLKKYFSYHYPHTAKVKAGNSLRDPGVIKDGRNVGKNLVVYRAIEEKERDRGLRIGS